MAQEQADSLACQNPYLLKKKNFNHHAWAPENVGVVKIVAIDLVNLLIGNSSFVGKGLTCYFFK